MLRVSGRLTPDADGPAVPNVLQKPEVLVGGTICPFGRRGREPEVPPGQTGRTVTSSFGG